MATNQTNRTTKTALRLAVAALAVLLLCGAAFAGAASAADRHVSDAAGWMALVTESQSGTITDNIIIDESFSLAGQTNPMIKQLSGNLSGNNKVISNFVIDCKSSSEIGIGLIGYYTGTSIKNLTISNFSVTSDSTYVGGLVGLAESASSSFAFENLKAEFGNISSDYYVGGLVGNVNSASFADCGVAYCSISAGNNPVGGLVSNVNSASFENCSAASCSISAGIDSVGGLCGIVLNTASISKSTVTNCIISSSTCCVGGLVGAGSLTSITNSNVVGCTMVVLFGPVGGLGGPCYGNLVISGNILKSNAVRGDTVDYTGEVFGCTTSHAENLSDYSPSQVRGEGTNYLNNDNNATDPKITIAEGNVLPSGAKQITKLTGIGYNHAYSAISYVTDPVGIDLVGFLIDTENLSNVWPAADPKLYWTTDDSAIEIPVGVNKTSGGQYLYAYNFTLVGNLTDKVGTPTASTFTSTWTEGQIVNNNWHVALYGDALDGDKVDISKNVSILTISIPAKTLEKEHYYNLSIPHGELGVTSTTALTYLNQVELSTGDSQFFPYGDKKFVIFVRNISEDLPQTIEYEPDDYPKFAPNATFFFFTERLDGQDKLLNVTAITDPEYDNDYDINNWTLTDTGSIFTAPGLNNESVTAHDGGKLTNNATINGTASGTATVTLVLNKNRAGVNTTFFTISAEPWLKSLVTNDKDRAGDALKGKSAVNWSFVTPLIYNYTVSAGPVTPDWDTHVKLGNETYGNATSGTAVSVVWNGTVSYNVTGTFGLKNETGKITSDTNFTVVQNTIADGTKRVLVTLTGYKLGDANIDDKVNIADSAVVGITVLKGDSSEAGLTFLPYENRLYADCDASRSGTIDVADILAINRFIVGLDPWAAA